MYLLFKLVRFFAILFMFVLTTLALISQSQSIEHTRKGERGGREGREGCRERGEREKEGERERERHRCSYYLCTGKSKLVN